MSANDFKGHTINNFDVNKVVGSAQAILDFIDKVAKENDLNEPELDTVCDYLFYEALQNVKAQRKLKDGPVSLKRGGAAVRKWLSARMCSPRVNEQNQ